MRFIYYILLSLCALVSCKGNTDTKIALQPYGNFDSILLDTIQASIERTYGFKTIILKSQILPSSAYINVKSPRYRADTIIANLKRSKIDSIDHVIGLTHKDISTTKRDPHGNVLEPKYKYEDWGIFGLGYVPGPSCVVSTFRLKTNDSNLLLERIKKVCNHELGHNLGLHHCTSNDKCVMKDGAESVKTVDHVNLVLCSSCKSKI